MQAVSALEATQRLVGTPTKIPVDVNCVIGCIGCAPDAQQILQFTYAVTVIAATHKRVLLPCW